MKVVITGGAGFIGCNAAQRFASHGDKVVVFDNLSRAGAIQNLKWLQSQHDITFVKGDVRDSRQVENLIRTHNDTDVVVHLAAQVAVTLSVENPREDFAVNALGTFNLLEAVRAFAPQAVFLLASTNKVYGNLEHLEVVEQEGRYQLRGLPTGVNEEMPLDFHSPYGCSKGAADQYAMDYQRIYGLKTVTFRQSCIYGYRQFGIEDQGWVAHFVIRACQGKPITIFGDGKQVRDVLFVDDLLNLFEQAVRQIDVAGGQAYNVGGGPGNQLSLLQLIEMLQNLLGRQVQYSFAPWRPGDQRVFVADISKAHEELGWSPEVPVEVGVRRLYEWVQDNITLFN